MKKSLLLAGIFAAFAVFANDVLEKQVFSLLKQAHKLSPQANVVLSPVSLLECFGTVSCGAGNTSAAELSQVLGLDYSGRKALQMAVKSLKASTVDFFSGNTAIFSNKITLDKEFVNKAAYFFNTKLFQADFAKHVQCRELLNSIAKEQSRGLFNDVFQDYDFTGNPLMILVNIMYYKGTWKSQFDACNTQKQLFYPEDGVSYQVKMMLDNKQVPYYNDGKIHGVVLDYADGRMRMLCLTPLEKSAPVSTVLETLCEKGINSIVDQASSQYETVIQLPVLDIAADNDLIPLLRSAGLKNVFDPEDSDLNKIALHRTLFISSARQLVKLKMNESGTETAAVTKIVAVESAPSAVQEKLNNFTANHPFVVILFDRKGNCMLLSAIVNTP